METKDLDYLTYFPFLSNSQIVLKELNITLEKIQNTNIFDAILNNVYIELNFLLNPVYSDKINYILKNPITDRFYEVSKFYLTILVLRTINNIALTRLWVKDFLKKIQFYIKEHVNKNSNEDRDKIMFFIDLFRLLETDDHFKPKKITLDDRY